MLVGDKGELLYRIRKLYFMTLTFSSIDSTNQVREFSWWFTSLEFVCDVLDSLVAKGSQLIKVELIDNDQRIQLPVQAFDGSSSSEAMRQLESEWRQVLSEPVDFRSVHNQWLIGLAREQVRSHEDRIARLELAIQAVEQRRQHVQDSIFDEPCRSILITRNEMAIQQYQQHLANAQLRQQTTLNQLRQLQNSIDD